MEMNEENVTSWGEEEKRKSGQAKSKGNRNDGLFKLLPLTV